MKVTPIRNRNPKSDNLMAIINGYPAWFPFDEQPTEGQELEVMITGVAYFKHESGHIDYSRLKCVFVRAVNPAVDIPIKYEGFECSGSMCSTLSTVKTPDGKSIAISPGRTGVYEADNVNVGWHGQTRKPLRPGNGWMRRLPGRIGRLEGVEHFSQLQFFTKEEGVTA